ncbi:hypothetical protein C5167_000163 [Papaver somniferum]|uniref:TF-B3 domain-containing protein n=1 Tax=Papaver somniferum TaxID=3469 RepID=A0A4Y7KSY5_PAPSO|nr:B3 domain-containing protein Os05g0481400-like [Papaver somniferum]RZC75907.1 hypothetical protein C5167_000163 [Papaver somniferum]
MADANFYEEARKQRMEENLRRFQDLGVAKIAKSLTDQATKPKPKAIAKPRAPAPVDPNLVRRSSRPHTTVTSYAEEFIEDRPARKKPRSGFSTRVKKPHEKVATEAQRAKVIKHAEDYRVRHVPSANPSYVKSMLQSHVYNGFWLNVPRDFCKKYLPGEKTVVVLEDAKGAEFDVVYTGEKENAGLSGGWKAFAEAHKLDDGDALIFELTEPARLKVHIFKGIGTGDEGLLKGKKKAKGGKGKKSDAKEDMVEAAAENTTQPRERKTRNSKKAGE